MKALLFPLPLKSLQCHDFLGVSSKPTSHCHHLLLTVYRPVGTAFRSSRPVFQSHASNYHFTHQSQFRSPKSERHDTSSHRIATGRLPPGRPTPRGRRLPRPPSPQGRRAARTAVRLHSRIRRPLAQAGGPVARPCRPPRVRVALHSVGLGPPNPFHPQSFLGASWTHLIDTAIALHSILSQGVNTLLNSSNWFGFKCLRPPVSTPNLILRICRGIHMQPLPCPQSRSTSLCCEQYPPSVARVVPAHPKVRGSPLKNHSNGLLHTPVGRRCGGRRCSGGCTTTVL